MNEKNAASEPTPRSASGNSENKIPETETPETETPKRGLDALKSVDTRDDRLEVLRLFEFLLPGERLWFLRWCERKCREAGSVPDSMQMEFQPQDPKAGIAAEESANLFYLMAVHYGLDLPRALDALEFFVKRKFWE